MYKRTLLIVDDEENILKSLYRVLRQENYQVIQANSGQQGLIQLENNPDIGVILSDQRMPNMTGTEFLAQARKICPDTVRMVLSGYTDLITITDSINQGAIFKFLTKPWNSEMLLTHVKEAFEYYELKLENKRLTMELQCINSDLEQRVADKTSELMFNIHALQTSQEVLEFLPIAVLGIDEEGMIVLANKEANGHFIKNNSSLIGKKAVSSLPEKVFSQVQQTLNGNPPISVEIKIDDTFMRSTCRLMAHHTFAKGVILVIMPA